MASYVDNIMWILFFMRLQNTMQIRCCSPHQSSARVFNLAHRSSPVVGEYSRLMHGDAVSGAESDRKITCSIVPPKLKIEARKQCSACGCKQLGPRRLSLACCPMLTAITNLRLGASMATVRFWSILISGRRPCRSQDAVTLWTCEDCPFFGSTRTTRS